MSRDHLTPEKQEAHRLLDAVRAGALVPEYRIRHALWVLGDLTGAE